jgi:hypothetical protein
VTDTHQSGEGLPDGSAPDPDAGAGGARVALIVDDALQPDWVARLARLLVDRPELDVFVLTVPNATEPDRFVPGVLGRALFASFERYDRRRAGAGDADCRTDLRRVVGSGRIVAAEDGDDRFAAGVYFAAGDPDAALCSRFDAGIVTVVLDCGDPRRPGAREVLAGTPVLRYSLRLSRADAAPPAVLVRAVLRTNRHSIAATTAHFQFHLTQLLEARLPALAHESPCLAAAATDTPQTDTPQTDTPQTDTPQTAAPSTEPPVAGPPLAADGLVRLAGSLSRMAARRIEAGVRGRLQQEDWALAAVRVDDPRSPLHFDPRRQRPAMILPPPGTIWADPFPMRRDGRTWVFFEEMERSTRRGHISILELTEQLQPRAVGRVLAAPYHLSYPFIFSWRGELFMLPETEENRTVEVYRCVAWPEQWTLEAVLLDGVSAADATLVEASGRWWMFTTMNPPRDADWDTNLHLFHADNPLGPWTPHPCNPVKSDVRNSRSAGRPFWLGERLYRPAQDCAERYGHAIVINEVTRLDVDGFAEREAGRIEGWRSDIVGVHTVNQEDDVLLLDCRIRRRKARDGYVKVRSALRPGRAP